MNVCSANFEIIPVGAVSGGEAYLYKTNSGAVLVDSGYAFCGEQLAQNIASALDGNGPDVIVLTHSHYDHVCGAAAVKKRFPKTQIIASAKTAQVLHKPHALEMMRTLDSSAARANGEELHEESKFRGLEIDRIVCDGDRVTFGNDEFDVYETPGHTLCSISLFCPTNGLLIASETLGIPMGRNLSKPGYLVGYQMTINSIKRMQDLLPQYILVPHNGLLGPEESAPQLNSFLYWAEEIKNRVVAGHFSGKSDEKLVDEFKQLYFYADISRVQVEESFLINARHMVNMLIRECTATDN